LVTYYYYGLEVCPLTKTDLKSQDFVINRFFVKLFRTSNIDIAKTCQSQFSFDLPRIVVEKRVKKFNKSLTKSTLRSPVIDSSD